MLSNPDMLHQGILPYHSKWARFFGGLRYVVVDEMHTYRGVFGSHMALVLRRLRRVVPPLRSRSGVPVLLGHDRAIRASTPSGCSDDRST